MSDPYVGEIKIIPYNRIPRGWSLCAGSLLPISEYAALYSLIGTMYGGSGTSNFKLPGLRGRTPVGAGTGPGLDPTPLAYWAGYNRVPIQEENLPSHTHTLAASDQVGNSTTPNGNVLSASGAAALQAEVPAGIPVTGTVKSGMSNVPLENGQTSEARSITGAVATAPYQSGAPNVAMDSSSIGNTGGNQHLYNMQPFLALNFIIALDGIYPTPS